ncbi:MAG: serine/threonine kinase PknH [Solirubrobacteraceae bacterium]|nr:serine/threonine kinase PknH [Solirubrobacteraceae bacterium]
MSLASHVELPERYRVTRHIASGGMASVWEVEDLLLDRIVAVKVLGAHFAADPRAGARFQREARTAARVSEHPHIATIYDIGEHASDAFIVMEYFAGGTVADRLRAARERGTRVPQATALRWLREAAAGLDVAHAAGIVHRDVKPANLLLDAQDRLAVCDFGIARLADDTHMTQTGQVLGTVAYLSPEQALGQAATAASDRYALAVVAYELLTGKRPFDDGPATAQLRQHAEKPPPRASQTAPELPAAIDPVLLRGLAKDPAARPKSAISLVDDIERALTHPERTVDPTVPITPLPAPVPAPRAPEPEPEPEPPWLAPSPPPSHDPLPGSAPEPVLASASPRRSPIIPLLAIAAVLAGAVVAFAFTTLGTDNQRTAREQSTASQPAGARKRASTAARATSEQQAAETVPAPAVETVPAPATETAPSTATAPATATTTAPPKAQRTSAQSSDPFKLNAQGFALINSGRYGEAVQPLQASVERYRSAGKTGDVNFAYALFNLGVALNRSGNPAAAIDVLRERLKYANQRETVQAELADARARLGGGGGSGGVKPDKSKSDY